MPPARFKKAFFYTALLIAVLFLFKAIKIIVFDLTALTAYGWGYLVGNCAIAFLFFGLAHFAFKNR